MAFPTTAILDNFNRADGALGANWTGPALGDSQSLVIVSNAATAPTNTFAANYWNPATYGPDVEVYVTVAIRSVTVGIYWRLSSPGGGTYSGYGINWSTTTVTIYKITAGSALSLGTIAQSSNDGDAFGVSHVGSLITVYYKPAAGAWGSIGTISDGTFTAAGNLALECDRTVASLDDFGGGTISSGVIPALAARVPSPAFIQVRPNS